MGVISILAADGGSVLGLGELRVLLGLDPVDVPGLTPTLLLVLLCIAVVARVRLHGGLLLGAVVWSEQVHGPLLVVVSGGILVVE